MCSSSAQTDPQSKLASKSPQDPGSIGQTSPTLPRAICTTPPCRRSEHRAYRESDQRRNLYVLGLPYTLKMAELQERFSPYGHVSHVVILATVDSASRRRGFVVMSSHREALAAINALNGTQIHDQTIEVSWAVVQRSHGFMDGADRLAMIEAQPAQHAEFEPRPPQFAPPAPRPSNSANALLISNLPALLFSHVSDLHPLVCPYGIVDKLEIMNSCNPANSMKNTVSAIVEFRCSSSAQEALSALDQQVYADQVITIRYISTPFSPNSDSSASKFIMQPQQVSSPLFDPVHCHPLSQSFPFASIMSSFQPRDHVPFPTPALSSMPLQSLDLMNPMPFYASPRFPPNHYNASYTAPVSGAHGLLPVSPCVFMNHFSPPPLLAWGHV